MGGAWAHECHYSGRGLARRRQPARRAGSHLSQEHDAAVARGWCTPFPSALRDNRCAGGSIRGLSRAPLRIRAATPRQGALLFASMFAFQCSLFPSVRPRLDVRPRSDTHTHIHIYPLCQRRRSCVCVSRDVLVELIRAGLMISFARRPERVKVVFAVPHGVVRRAAAAPPGLHTPQGAAP